VIPNALHHRFKVKCAIDSTEMSAAIRDLIAKYCPDEYVEKARGKSKSKAEAM
jgi:hypothetical protein